MVKIALISDIHFGELAATSEFAVPGCPINGDPDDPVSLTESLTEILRKEAVNYLFISGDLTSRAKPQEFKYCIEKIITIVSKSGIPESNIVWTIGNHDIDWKITKIAEQYSEEVKDNPDLLPIVEDGYRLSAVASTEANTKRLPHPTELGDVPLSGIYETSDFIVFILNSALFATHSQIIKHGKLSKPQLDWLNQTLLKHKNDRRWKIILTHHHPDIYPFPTVGHDISYMEDGPQLIDIAASNGINLILHGHRHHPKAFTRTESNWGNPITLICAGSLSVNVSERTGEIPNTFHIIELSDDPGICTLFSYQYTIGEGWIPIISEDKRTPLDYKMLFGKCFSDGEAEKAARNLWTFPGDVQRIKTDTLPEELRYCSREKVEEILMNTKPHVNCDVVIDWNRESIIFFKEDSI